MFNMSQKSTISAIIITKESISDMSEIHHAIKQRGGKPIFKWDILMITFFFWFLWSEFKYPGCVTNHAADFLYRSGRRRGDRTLKR